MSRRRVAFECQIKGCNEPHHAKGFCNVHYKKYKRLGDPTAGNFRDRSGRDRNEIKLFNKNHVYDEPYKDLRGKDNYSFFLNQKAIEVLYGEIYKIHFEPLYMASNQRLIEPLLLLCLNYAGYEPENPFHTKRLVGELLDRVKAEDKINFMYTLANWYKVIEQDRKPQNVEQLTLYI